MKKFTEATNEFVKAADWLTDADGPSVTALHALAEELDKAVSAALVSQYTLVHRSLLKRAPAETPEVDELEAALADAGE